MQGWQEVSISHSSNLVAIASQAVIACLAKLGAIAFCSSTMSPTSQLYFIALLPPEPLQAEATAFKEHFAAHYDSRAALKSPPHITLQPPFQWPADQAPTLETTLQDFAAQQAPLEIQLSGFGAFPPRVIYLHVHRSEPLLALQRSLRSHLETTLAIADPSTRPFAPHLTLAYKDLRPDQFQAAWPQFRDRPFNHQFTAQHLTLLLHRDRRWHPVRTFSLRP
ncbi:Phosphoesterase HXTX [Geitlerinema sp. PCC 7407]|nr:Phosphoesterase HXTX [Geitlerinema sp. PCC 7407]